MKNKQFAVIGIGRFGESLIKELTRLGYEVLAIDVDENRINEAVGIVTHAIQADSMDENTLKAIGIRNFDVVIVAIGDNIQSNILTSIILKEMGVRTVVAKAQNALHGKVLEKIGVDHVIYPERDMAIKLARSLVSHNFLEQINLSSTYSIIELFTPHIFINKNLTELDLRKKMRISILAIRRGEDIIVAPSPDEKVLPGDILVVLGNNADLEAISKLD
ncbi:potassium channel family protein [Syntrophomonas wolfei]|uniref:potassium channel family protein n=1 Tax=Syntrophomonas wolfei TaxID=863 RepID=UPI0023F4636B|nr:TrkA family potassium uptake protein [Syntrophomonas wolfei]